MDSEWRVKDSIKDSFSCIAILEKVVGRLGAQSDFINCDIKYPPTPGYGGQAAGATSLTRRTDDRRPNQVRLMSDRFVRRRPGVRAVNRASALSDGNFVGKLALRGKVTGNVLAESRVIRKIGPVVLRIKHDDLTTKIVPDEIQRRNEIGIAAHEREGFDIGCVGIAEHSGSDIYQNSLNGATG